MGYSINAYVRYVNMGGPTIELKEVKEGKRNRSSRMTRAIAVFLQSKTVVDLNKSSKDRLEIL